jgi:general secretion pathway protein D
MKSFATLTFVAVLLVLAAGCATPKTETYKQTYSSFDLPSDHISDKATPAGTINFQDVQANQVLDIYGKLSNRTVLRGQLPDVTINLHSTAALTKSEWLQMLDTALAQQGVTMVLMGDKAVKAVASSNVSAESPPEISYAWQMLPESSSYMMRTVQLKKLRAAEVAPMLAPLCGLPNSIVVIQNQNLLILRDYSSNIKQELRLLEELERK